MHKTRSGLLKAALKEGGLEAGMRFLNATVDHRYTGIYQFRSGELVCVALFDKAGQVQAAQLEATTLTTSLTPFIVAGQPGAQRMFQHCVPLADPAGLLLGTLCHFDHARHELPDEEFEFLRAVAREFAPYMPSTSGSD